MQWLAVYSIDDEEIDQRMIDLHHLQRVFDGILIDDAYVLLTGDASTLSGFGQLPLVGAINANLHGLPGGGSYVSLTANDPDMIMNGGDRRPLTTAIDLLDGAGDGIFLFR